MISSLFPLCLCVSKLRIVRHSLLPWPAKVGDRSLTVAAPADGVFWFRMALAVVLGLVVVTNAQAGWCGVTNVRAAHDLALVTWGQVNQGQAEPVAKRPAKKAQAAGQDDQKAEKKPDVKEAKKDEAPDAKEKKPADGAPAAEKNPQLIKQLFRWGFGPAQPPGGRGVREAGRADDAEGGRNAERDFIDSRAPHDLKVEQVMRAAESSIRRKDWKTAQELLQRLLDLPEDSLHRLPDGRWQSVRRVANRLLGSAPAEVLADYETQYSGLAQQLLNDARRSGRTSDYVSVASRFLHTPSGYEAANYLGSLHFDRGEFGLAAAWFGEIAASQAPFASSAAWRMKAALAYRQAGDVEASKSVLKGLTDASGKQVHLGLGDVDPSAWISGLSAALPTRNTVLTDWPQIYGTAARIGTSIGGEPLLSPLWSVPLTSSHTVRRRLNWILQDLLDQDRTPVLAAMPLVVAGRAIYRDLRGVRAVDIETGKTIWESVEGISAERIIGGLPPQQAEPREAWRGRVNQFQFDQNEYQGQSAEYHPLASLLFRDGIYGVISSDGRQVFVIEDQGILSRNQPGHHWGWDGSGEPQDPYGVSWKTNRLVSYDLNTGRPRWSLGGVESQESFDLPLAGSYFYGTPAVDGDELLVVAGKGDDIRLWSLDRATGTPRWSQLIAYTDTKIEQDLGRRWFTAQVASDGGIIVCPTTVGWLVAVDRLRQTVLWAHRYLPPAGSQERDPGTQYVPQRDLNSQWSPSAPVIAGNVVVYTPPEEPIILALNMLDGRRLWEKTKESETPRESWLYLAGVFGDRVVLVGKSGVEAFHVSTGKSIWSASLEDAHPSGRGQAVEEQYYLPLSSGELRVLDLKTGKTVSRGYVSTTQPPLGNLAMHQGKLIAVGPQGMVGFGQRQAVIAEIQRRKALNPSDSWALLREAEIHLLNREHAAALPLLRSIQVDGLTDDERSRHHDELVQCLATVFRQDPKLHQQELDELGRIARTSDEKRLHQELTADYLVTESRFREAFDILWSLQGTGDLDALIPRSDDSQVSMVHRVWLSGRLMTLWNAASEADRDQVNARILSIVADAEKADLPSRRAVARLIGFHPASVRLRESLVEDWAKAGDFARAQLELLDLAGLRTKAVADAEPRGDNPSAVLNGKGADPVLVQNDQAGEPDRAVAAERLRERQAGSLPHDAVAARATERLARLMEQFQLPADAAHYYRILETELGDVPWRDGMTCAEFVNRLRGEGKIHSKRPGPGYSWDDRPLQLVQGPMQYMPPSQELAAHSPLPFFDPFAIEVQQQEQRLAFEYIATSAFAWLAPLRSSPRNQGDGYAAAEFVGHQTVLINRDVLHVFSPVEKRLLWARTLDGSGEGGPFWRHASRPPLGPMTAASRDAENSMALLQNSAFSGRLAAAQPSYVCVYGRRSISVLDPQTGELLWRKEGIPQYAQVIGNRDAIFVVPQDRSKDDEKTEAFRAFDGKPLQIDGLGNLLRNSLLMNGESLVLLEPGPRFLGFNSKTILRMHHPISKQDRWRAEYASGTLVSVLDQDTLLVLPPDGKVERIEVATGRRMPLTPLPPEDVKARRNEVFALMDDTHIYLIINVQDTTGFHHYGESLPSVRANGVIHAWKRTDGSRAWRQDVKQQNLVVDHFRALPVLVFVSRSWKQKGNMSYGTLSIQAIHKQTGNVLHKSETPTMYSGFHSLDVNLSEPSIELKSYNLRMRLVPASDAAAKPEVPGAATKSNG